MSDSEFNEMYSKGHAGLTLLLVSILMLPFGDNQNALIVIVLSAGLSALPDIDMELRKQVSFIHHRGVTHSVLFAIVSGLVFSGLFFYSHGTLLWAGMGFLSAFLGVISHLIGDSFTYHSFKPLWPFSEREVSYGFCRANDRSVNEGLMTAGGLALIAYYFISTGSLQLFLP